MPYLLFLLTEYKTLPLQCASISPADSNYVETISTLRYAGRAKSIQNRTHINDEPKDALLRHFQEEIAELKKQLEDGAFEGASGDDIDDEDDDGVDDSSDDILEENGKEEVQNNKEKKKKKNKALKDEKVGYFGWTVLFTSENFICYMAFRKPRKHMRKRNCLKRKHRKKKRN